MCVSEYKHGWKLLLPIYVSEPGNKGEVAQAEGDAEAGDLVRWAIYWHITERQP